jgi:hypothetical protein
VSRGTTRRAYLGSSKQDHLLLPGDTLLVDAPDGTIRFERVPAKDLA